MTTDDTDYFYAGPNATMRGSNGELIPQDQLVRNKFMRRIIRRVSYSQKTEHKVDYKLAVLREELAGVRTLSDNSHQYKRELARALKERRIERLVVREHRRALDMGTPISADVARHRAGEAITRSLMPTNEKIFRPHR